MVTTDSRSAVEFPAELLSQARAGCPEAFCALGRAHQDRIFRQALALCGDSRLAEELAAETLVEAWRSLSRFNGTCRFSTWLYAILLHRHQKVRRRPRSRPIPFSDLDATDMDAISVEAGAMVDGSPHPDRVLSHEERAAELLEAIGTLPAKYQHVLLLRFYEDASLQEMAVALGISLGTVKSRLHHALDKLRRSPAVVNLFLERRDG